MTRDFVEKALVNNPGLTGRFYKFLATLLADRIRTKKTVSDAPLLTSSNEPLTSQQFRVQFNLKDRNASPLQEWTVALAKSRGIQLFGRMILSQTVLCFQSGVLGSDTKILIPLNDITHIETQHRVLTIKLRVAEAVHTFSDVAEPDEMKEIIHGQITVCLNEGLFFHGTNNVTSAELDWSIFLGGAELRRFNASDVILQEGQITSYIFQVGYGVAVVQRDFEGAMKNIRELKPGELFGEMAFLQERAAASANIIAGQDNTMVYCIKKAFVDSLLTVNANAELPGRFYKYLATSLAGRLRN